MYNIWEDLERYNVEHFRYRAPKFLNNAYQRGRSMLLGNSECIENFLKKLNSLGNPTKIPNPIPSVLHCSPRESSVLITKAMLC